jgi:uncharacterized protein involved in outer membrane biogenesis
MIAMSLPRRTKIALTVVGTMIMVPSVALTVLLNYDWNRIKPWLNLRAGEAIGRPFAIDGDLLLTWRRTDANLPDQSWRDFLPWPHLVAKDVRVGNPMSMDDTAKPTDMVSVRQLSFSLSPVALLDNTISIPELRFETPVVALQRTADGNNNWTFAANDAPSPWKLDLRRVVFSKGSVRLVDVIKKTDITFDLDTLLADPIYGVTWKVNGNLGGEPVSGSGKAGAALSLQRQMTPYPVVANIKVGATTIGVEGTLTKPADLAAIDMRLHIAGASMGKLYGLTGILLPETPPFSTDGHLLGSLGAGGSRWTYDDFKGNVGSSDIGGKFVFEGRQPRPRLSGVVNSRSLQLSDLAPLIGADSDASQETRGVVTTQPPNKVLPVETFKTERWTSIDIDVKYSAEEIIRDKDLPINKLNTHITLQDGVLSLAPLNFSIAGGTLASTIKLDASGGDATQTVRAEMTTSARHLELKQLLPPLPTLQASVGEINGDAKLSAVGNSIASLLGSSNGEIKALINEGTISKLLLEQMGLNIGNVVLSRLFGDEQVKINCMASDFVIADGVMQTRSFIVDTKEALLNISGNINLAREQLDLTLNPDSKGLRVFSLRAPLYLNGSFKNPVVSVDKGVLAMRAGGALALAVVAPIAALLPLISTNPDQASECGKLLAQAGSKPRAPPPGKASR